MKNRFLSLLLTFAMLLPFFHVWSLDISAKTAATMTEAEAFEAGLDVYVAWYNHKRTFIDGYSDRIQDIFKDNNSSFNRLFTQIFPEGPNSEEAEELLSDSKRWLEDHFDGVHQFDIIRNDVIMSLLLSCVLYTGQSASSDKNDIENAEKLLEDFVKNGYDIYDAELVSEIRKFATDFSTEISLKKFLEDAPEKITLGEYSFGVITDLAFGIVDERKNYEDAIANAAKYDIIGSASARDIDILRRHQDDAFLGEYIKLYIEAYEDIWETGSSSFKEMLTEEYSNYTDTFIDICSSSIEAGLGVVAASASSTWILTLTTALAMGLVGFEIFNIMEGVWKLSGDFLFGQTAMRTADITLYYLDYIRCVLYSGYIEAYYDFFFEPNTENAKMLNAYSRLMYRVFAASEMYASQLNDTYATSGVLNMEWMHYIPGKIDPELTDIAKWQSEAQLLNRDSYLSIAYDEYLNFCENNVYNIFLNMNGGTFPVAEQLGVGKSRIPICKIYSIDAKVPSGIPSREGYKFLGWTDVEGGSEPKSQYAPGSVYSREADIELYAVWQRQYKITYDANRGTGAPPAAEHYGNTLVSSTVPTRVGFEFLGWSENASAGTAAYISTDSSKNRITKVGDVKLYAVWKALPFDIIFDANGGVYSNGSYAETRQKLYLQPFTIDFEAPEREGYDFLGWSGRAGGGVQYKHVGAEGASSEDATYYDIGGSGLASKTLYAVWRRNTASFTYDYGDFTTAEPFDIKLEGGSAEYILEPPEAEKAASMGRDFLRWKYYYPNGTVVYYNIGDSMRITGDTVVYAEWESPAETPMLSLLTDKKSYKPGERVKISVVALNSEYFEADASANSGFYFDSALGGSAAKAKYYEKGSVAGDSALKCYDNGSEYALYLTIPTSCADGVYYVDITLYGSGSVSEALPIKVASETEEASSYVISYDLGGGKGSVPESEYFEEYEYVVLSEADGFERDGYEFGGWCEKADGSGRIYKAGREYQFTDSHLFYAVWNPIEGYGDLDLALMVERYSGVYKPGETAHVFVYPHYSNHFYFDVSSCPGFTIRNPVGDRVTGDTWIDKESPNYDSSMEGYNDGGMIAIYIYIPESCPDGQYTFYCTASNGLLQPDNTSGGDKMKKSVTINVRKSDDADSVLLSKEEMIIHIGDEKRLTATVLPAFFTEKEVTWKNGNSKVISLEERGNKVYISGIKSGSATVTATVDGVSALCNVRVVKCDYEEKYPEAEYLAKAASCTSAAKYYYVCSCGEVSGDTYSYGEPLSHSFSEWSTLKDATEFEAGIRLRVCSVCSHSETEAIAATGHSNHTPGEHWFSDDISHWQECYCGEMLGRAVHIDNGGGICSVCSAALLPADPIVFSVGCKDAEAGDTVEIRLSISGNPGFSEGGIELEFDRSAMSFIGYRCEYEWTPVTNYDEDPDSYPISFAWDSEEDIIGEGAIILAFEIAPGAASGEHRIQLRSTGDFRSSNGRSIPCETSDGSINIVGGLIGDSNGDDKINTKDAVLLAQHLAGWLVFIDLDTADCNRDGSINTKDAVLLAQYLAGWNVTLK